jgi:hypothetical protein
MKQKRHKPEEVIRLLWEHDASGKSQEQVCREKQISVAALNRWRKRHGQMDEADARCLKALEKENAELKKTHAETMLGTGGLPSRTRTERSLRPWKKTVSAAHHRDLGTGNWKVLGTRTAAGPGTITFEDNLPLPSEGYC